MKYKAIYLAGILAWYSGNTVAQNALRVVPERPVAGDSVTFYYNPDSTLLKGLAPVTGVIYLYRNYDWDTQDLAMQMTDSGWVGHYRVPPDAALLIPNFSANGKTDKGGIPTYARMTSQRNGTQTAGAYPAWAFLRTKEFRNEVPPGAADSVSITNEVALFWMNNELRYHPESRRKIFYDVARLVKRERGDKADTIIAREISYLSGLKDVTEPELMDISKVYRNIEGKRASADSLDKVIIAKFPLGITERDQWVLKLFRGGTTERYEVWKEFVQKFPVDQFKDVETETDRLYYDKGFRSIVYDEVGRKKNYKILDEMIGVAPVACLTEFHRLLVMGPFDHEAVTAEFILPYSVKLVTELEARTHTKAGAISKFYSPLQWEQYLLGRLVPAFMGHAALLHKLRDDKAALVWIEKVKDMQESKSAEFMGLYATLLENNGRHQEALQIAENSASVNKATPESIALLKAEYIRKKKSDAGFDTYFNGLKSAEQMSEQQAHIRSQLIRKNAPTFRLEQLAGNYADLSKLKGKIVILDFWATWCGPCKAALPGMQMAVTKFSKDPSVNFFFIATQETKPDYRDQIKRYLKEKNYQLNVLYDAKSSTTGHLDDTYNKYAKELHFSGIPAKIIIDQHGMVRWSSNGYMGSPSALADEISYVIGLLKKEG